MLALRLVPLVSQVADSVASWQALFLLGFMLVLPTRGASTASANRPSWLFWSCFSAILWSDSPFLVIPAFRLPEVAVLVLAFGATFALPGLAPWLFPLAGSATCLLDSAKDELAVCLMSAVLVVFPAAVGLARLALLVPVGCLSGDCCSIVRPLFLFFRLASIPTGASIPIFGPVAIVLGA